MATPITAPAVTGAAGGWSSCWKPSLSTHVCLDRLPPQKPNCLKREAVSRASQKAERERGREREREREGEIERERERESASHLRGASTPLLLLFFVKTNTF